jgi:putative nucleotidyltransferase with HDIG domain
MARGELPRSPFGNTLSDRIRFHIVRWVPLLVTAVLTYLLFPPPAGVGSRIPDAGQRSERTVVAPFPFQVRKSTDEIAREGESRALTAQPVYRFSPTAYDSSLASARDFFADLERASAEGPELMRAVAASQAHLGPEETRYLADPEHRRAMRELVTHFLGDMLSRGVADAGVIRGEASRQITLRRNDAERVVARDSVLTFADLMEQAEAAGIVVEDPAGQRTLRRIVGAFYHPTIVPDATLTSARREQLRASVDPIRYGVRAGEQIVAAGQGVTEEIRAKLIGLRQEMLRRGAIGYWTPGLVGALLYNTIVLSVFWLLMVFYRRETYVELREMVFFGALFCLVIVITAGTTQLLLPIRPEMVPIPFAAILVTLLYSGRIGVFAALTLAVLLDGQWALGDTGILFFGLVGGVAGAIGIRAVRRRRHLYVTVAVVAAASVLASLTIGLLQGWATITIVASALLGSLMALASAALAMLVMPLAESGTRITTDLTLLELSDLGRPLLRRLALEAPGTWAHSLAMANLCESACNIIGANGLLARVGCYYHDIGKLGAPGFFVENQGGGPNPHDQLPPTESARIIRQHVLDGIALAEAAGLPRVVKAFIPEHHGTSEITYFLMRARHSLGNGVPNPADYRYPGPRPQSAETAVAMLADSAEAAIRVLPEPTPDKVREAIELLVQQKLTSGQLDDAPLTLRDLDRVKREFARVMSGTYHKRIGYPRASGGITPEFQTAERQ